MGTWGDGNLDNDYALDDLSARTSELVRQLWQRAHRPSSREGDDYDYTTLFVELELVFALDAANLMRAAKFPAASEAEALAEDYLAAWEEEIVALAPTPEHVENRRRVIGESFARFATICTKYQGKIGNVAAASPNPVVDSSAPAQPKPVAKKPSVVKKTPPAKKRPPAKKKPPAKKRR